jgi:hypothetical protein
VQRQKGEAKMYSAHILLVKKSSWRMKFIQLKQIMSVNLRLSLFRSAVDGQQGNRAADESSFSQRHTLGNYTTQRHPVK